ncbi:DsbA family oxidoreductase [Aspergillus stella-maris]|uniref:DsbA family oxidoreductase n=1 Tax=Aspergillus stella-maris TaxID=1810926 RepID=UPI003CCCD5DA
MTNFNIQIISDAVCPWCYVGYRRLSRAIATHTAKFPSDTFKITWSPFYLNASSPSFPGADKTAFYESKFGAARTGMIFQRLAAVGAEEGIKFSFGGRTGKTRDAHRVIWLAGRKEKDRVKERESEGKVGGIQTRVVEKLFAAYFEEEKNITDREVLIEAAVGGGLERGEVEGLLSEGYDEGGKVVDEEAEGARKQFVTGVPYFMVQGMYAVEGADEPDTFLEVFSKVKGVESS